MKLKIDKTQYPNYYRIKLSSNKSDEQIVESLSNEVKDKVETIHKYLNAMSNWAQQNGHEGWENFIALYGDVNWDNAKDVGYMYGAGNK